jgi:hypothetical protein
MSKTMADTWLDAAVSSSGLDDFGDERYLDDYHRAIAAITDQVAISPAGMAVIEEWVTRTLVNVLRMQRDLRDHPEIHDEVLASPIVITGFARTGTTKLQRMVSVSPATQSLATWRLLNPAPLARTAAGSDPRIAVAEQVSDMIATVFPEMWAAHPMPARDADEDMGIHDMSFIAPTIGMRFAAWGYMKANTPMNRRVLEFLRTVLKYLQWQDGSPERSSRPWVLKSPIHIGNIETMRAVFPGATFVFCHREIETLMASLCRLVEVAAGMVSDSVDRLALGAELLAYWSGEWVRGLAQREQLDDASYIDLRFEAINRDGVAAAEQVHRLAGLTFDDAARDAAIAWEASTPQHVGGSHEYRLGDYGLTEGDVREAFTSYRDRFWN